MTPTLVAELWLASFFAVFARPRRRPPDRPAHGAPERCLILGDAEAIGTVRGKLENGGVNAKVVASVRAGPALAARRHRALPLDRRATTTSTA